MKIKSIFIVGHNPLMREDKATMYVSSGPNAGVSAWHCHTEAFTTKEKAEKYADWLRKVAKVPDVIVAEVGLDGF